jgi:outer membrane protein assembly factor BamD (BamD/ComL family)
MRKSSHSLIKLTALTAFVVPMANAKDNTPKLAAKASDETTIEGNESEFKKIGAALGDLNQQINSVPRTATAAGLGAQLVEANRAYDYAVAAFKRKDWLSVINETSAFLSLSQKPEPRTWLKAQFMIARAYEEQGQLLRATRAYTRYLATFTTKPTPDLSDLTETFERLVRIATKSSEANQSELSTFLSSIAAMEHPSSVSEELRYLTAVAGSNIGNKGLAITWLSDVDGRADVPETRARAKYFRALIAINGKEWEEASNQLEAILQLDGLSAKTKDNARLSLGRVFIKQKRPQLALAAYSQIPETSEAFRDASFEKTFLLIRQGQDDEARAMAHQWLAKFPEHEDATQLRILSSWLDLRAGDLDAAKANITGNTDKLSAIQASLARDYQITTLRQEDAVRLSKLTRGQVTPSPELEEILAMFRQVAEMSQRLAEVDGAERSIVYAIAKGDLRQFKPALANRMEQYDRLADDVLANGSKLIFVERQRLSGTLTDLDKQKLAASEKRRLALFDKRSQLARQAKRWATWAAPAEQLVKLAREWEKLNRVEAALTSTVSGATPKNNKAGLDTTDLSSKIATVRQDMMKALSEIRQIQASTIVEQSQIDDILFIVQQYASAIHEESQIIASYEPASGRMLDSLDDEDSRRVWNLWRDVIGTLHANIKDLKNDAGADLAGIFEHLAKIDNIREGLTKEVDNLRNVLETYGGESLAGIIAHYDNAVSQRLARQYKWAGDLEYLNYTKARNDHEASAKKQALEVQILSDNLRDIEQGGATQWPR